MRFMSHLLEHNAGNIVVTQHRSHYVVRPHRAHRLEKRLVPGKPGRRGLGNPERRVVVALTRVART